MNKIVDAELQGVFDEYDKGWAEIVAHGEDSPELIALHKMMMTVRKTVTEIDETRKELDKIYE